MSAVAPSTSVFGAARERALEKALPDGRFLKADERNAMHSAGTPFWLVGATVTESKDYGERATFKIVLTPDRAPNGEFSGELILLDLDSNAVRVALIEELTPILATQHILGPLYLTKFATKSGNPAWDITDEHPSV